MFDLVVRNGDVVTPEGVQRGWNIGVTDGRIVTLTSEPVHGAQEIEAEGQYVFPGFIDTHTHIGFAERDDELVTETVGAAVGGITTCLIYFRDLRPYGDNLRSFIRRGASGSSVDFGVHLGVLIDEHLDQIQELSRELGITSFKMYTCYKDDELAHFGVRGEDDGFMSDAMAKLALIPGCVVNVHSENDDIYHRRLENLEAGVVGGTPLEQWSWTRPPFGEAEAISRVALFARRADVQVFIPHVGSAEALEACLRARAVGTKLAIETCPHYLVLTAEDAGPIQYAKVNPPVRHEDDRRALVEALSVGEVDTIGTDHAAIPLAGKVGKSISDARPGFPGVDVMVPILVHLVVNGQLRPEVLARATARSAELFGLRSKGRLALGWDADLTICDPTTTRVVRAAELPSCSDLSVYEGMTLSGWPSWTILRGQIVAHRGKLLKGEAGAYLMR